jgi:hypothetical protein
VSQVSKYYQSDLRTSDTVATVAPTDASWGLGVSYENTVKNISDSVS